MADVKDHSAPRHFAGPTRRCRRLTSTRSGSAPVADDIRGELARAYIVLRPGPSATEDEIIEHCRPHLAAYKLPRSVRFVPDLPKTSTGKVLRRELKNLDACR